MVDPHTLLNPKMGDANANALMVAIVAALRQAAPLDGPDYATELGGAINDPAQAQRLAMRWAQAEDVMVSQNIMTEGHTALNNEPEESARRILLDSYRRVASKATLDYLLYSARQLCVALSWPEMKVHALDQALYGYVWAAGWVAYRANDAGWWGNVHGAVSSAYSAIVQA